MSNIIMPTTELAKNLVPKTTPLSKSKEAKVAFPSLEMSTSKKIKIFIAAIFAVLAIAAIVGATVFGMGLPLIIAGVVAGVASIISTFLAYKDKRAVVNQTEKCDDLCDYLETRTGTKRDSYIEPSGLSIQAVFKKDAPRNAKNTYMNSSRSNHTKCKEQFIISEYFSAAGASINAAQNEKEKVSNLIIEDFVNILHQQLGADVAKKLSEPISMALSQNMAIILKKKMIAMGQLKYGGEIAQHKDNDAKKFDYYLEFPKGVAARIRVEAKSEFSYITNSLTYKTEEMNPGCKFDATVVIDIGHDGKSKIKTKITYSPK